MVLWSLVFLGSWRIVVWRNIGFFVVGIVVVFIVMLGVLLIIERVIR